MQLKIEYRIQQLSKEPAGVLILYFSVWNATKAHNQREKIILILLHSQMLKHMLMKPNQMKARPL